MCPKVVLHLCSTPVSQKHNQISEKMEKMEEPTPVDPQNFSIFLKVTPVSSLPKKNGKNGRAPPLLISKFPFLTSREKHYMLTILFGFCSVFPKKFQKNSKKNGKTS